MLSEYNFQRLMQYSLPSNSPIDLAQLFIEIRQTPIWFNSIDIKVQERGTETFPGKVIRAWIIVSKVDPIEPN